MCGGWVFITTNASNKASSYTCVYVIRFCVCGGGMERGVFTNKKLSFWGRGNGALLMIPLSNYRVQINHTITTHVSHLHTHPTNTHTNTRPHTVQYNCLLTAAIGTLAALSPCSKPKREGTSRQRAI